MSTFADDFFKVIKDKNTSIVHDRKGAAEFAGFIDTGCYALNALLSASIYGGVADNKLGMFAGEPSSGKTYLALSVVKSHLDADAQNIVVYYDTEAAVTADMMESRGIDTKRVILNEPTTIQQFRTHAINVFDKYIEARDAGKKVGKMLVILDSYGQLSTTKELEDSTAGNETRDMTKAQVGKATFRLLTLKAARATVPVLITNHVYDSLDMYSPKKISGGSGGIYSSSYIISLSKSKDKDKKTGKIGGVLIKCTNTKQRLAKENANVTVKLDYAKGLDKYYGLLPFAEASGAFKKVSTKYELPNGKTEFGVTIEKNPEKYFTPEVLEKIEAWVNKEFAYGGSEWEDETTDAEVDEVAATLAE